MLYIMYEDNEDIPDYLVFSCYINFMASFDSRLSHALHHVLTTDYDVAQDDFQEYINEMNRLNMIVPNNYLIAYEDFDVRHFMFAYGILSNLIGKVLYAANYHPWFERRKGTYSAPTKLQSDDVNLEQCCPAQRNCLLINRYCNVKVEYTRFIFNSIRAASREPDLLHSPVSQVTMTMLSGTGITSFLFIEHWIVKLNPILLAWQELAKYWPAMSAAYKKYLSLGDDANYCKLLYPKEETEEFHRDNLKVLFSVAREIARQYGSSSVANLKGESDQQFIKDICTSAVEIVKAYGGSKTRTTQAVRDMIIDSYDNSQLLKRLDCGAEPFVVYGGEEEAGAPDIPA